MKIKHPVTFVLGVLCIICFVYDLVTGTNTSMMYLLAFIGVVDLILSFMDL